MNVLELRGLKPKLNEILMQEVGVTPPGFLRLRDAVERFLAVCTYGNGPEWEAVPAVVVSFDAGIVQSFVANLSAILKKVDTSGWDRSLALDLAKEMDLYLSGKIEQYAQGKLPREASSPEENKYLAQAVDEIKALLVEASKRRNSARWAIALALGLRQGEALGLKWSDVDLATGVLKVRRSRNRPKYKHGCEQPCGRKPGFCPNRHKARPDTAPTKSRAGRRTIGLPSELTAILREHWKEQAAERALARQLWNDEGWIFAGRTGKPLSPNMDYREWKALLAAAGLRDGRLHDARHTAATVLLLLGVPDRAVMDVMGWSSSTMVKRYQHITAPVRMDIAERVGGLLWAKSEGQAPTDQDRPEDGSAGALVSA